MMRKVRALAHPLEHRNGQSERQLEPVWAAFQRKVELLKDIVS